MGAVMVGEITSVQLSFIAVEILEVSIGVFLIIKSRRLSFSCG
jgi:hypothetical protein